MKKKRVSTALSLTVVMAIISTVILVPLLIMIFGSFKSAAEAQKFNIMLPKEWYLSNYEYVIKVGGIALAMKNSVILTASVTAITIIAGGLCAFVISRKNNRYTRFLYTLFLLGMISPLQVVTTFALLKILHLTGTYIGVIFVMTAVQLPWTIFMFSGFIKSVPKELDEAAFIDGATPVYMFFRIIVPLLKPILATTLVSTAMAAWNEFMIPLYFFNTSEKWTMPLTVYNFFGQYQSSWQYVFSDLVLTALPITILYLYCQKYIVSGMTAGAVKG